MAALHETTMWPNHMTLRGIDAVFFDEWTQRKKVGRSIFNVKSSDQYREHTLTVGGVGLMQQMDEGEQLTYISNNEGFLQTFTHVDYGNGMRATRRVKRDDLYGSMSKQARELGRSAAATEETTLANHFNRGFSASYTGADGVELFSLLHVREDGTTWANEPTSDADLSQTSLEQGLIDFSNQRDGGGKRIAIEAKKLIVPKELMFEAKRYMKSSKGPENDLNAINPIEGELDIVVWQYLTDTDAWFICSDKKEHGLCMYTREEPWTDFIDDFDTKDTKVSVMYSQSSGWSYPQGVYGSKGA